MSKNLNWLKVTIHHPIYAADALSCHLFEAEAQAVWEAEPDAAGRQVSVAGFPTEKEKHLEVFLPEIIDNLAMAFDLSPDDFEFNIMLEENHDWAEKWKEGLNPICINQKLIIAPTWSKSDDLASTFGSLPTLRLDPGLAFGSGHHATTFLCLEAITSLSPQAKRILDVGAGSGILSMAAALMNPFAAIVGIDNDADTIAVAEENAQRNGLGSRINFSNHSLDQLSGDFDFIVANITLNPLLELAKGISCKAGPNCKLVLSGLLETQAEQAADAYGQLGWRLTEKKTRDEWCALILSK